MRDDLQEYFRRRALEEHRRAAAATDARVHDIHLELAVRYEVLAEGTPGTGMDGVPK